MSFKLEENSKAELLLKTGVLRVINNVMWFFYEQQRQGYWLIELLKNLFDLLTEL